MDWLRADEVLREISKSGIREWQVRARSVDFFNKFDLERSDRVLWSCNGDGLEQIDVPQRMTIDVESTVITSMAIRNWPRSDTTQQEEDARHIIH